VIGAQSVLTFTIRRGPVFAVAANPLGRNNDVRYQ